MTEDSKEDTRPEIPSAVRLEIQTMRIANTIRLLIAAAFFAASVWIMIIIVQDHFKLKRHLESLSTSHGAP